MSTNPAPLIEGNLAWKSVPAPVYPVEHRKPRFSIASNRDQHATSPIAETKISSLSDNAIDREFSERRDRLVRIGRNDSVGRLAAFLVVAAHQNRNDGFGGFEIADTMNCAFVADLLGFSIEELSRTLLHLQSEGIVRSLPDGGLRIIDLSELERLADEGLSTLLGPENGTETRIAQETDARIEAIDLPTIAPRCYARAIDDVSIEDADASIRFGVVSAVIAACVCVAFAITSGFVAI
jgi:hypothetical protein